jgi:hypothetical protein
VVVPVEIDGDKRLVAYLVPPPGREPDIAAVRAELSRGLPGYLVPNHFVVLPRFPRTSSGKLDVRALPGIEAGRRASAGSSTAPVTGLERELWQIWADVLGIREFGVHDDFFVIGGHSLLATVAVTVIGDRLNAGVPLRALFDNPTITELAAWIEARPAGSPDEIDDLVAEVARSTHRNPDD